MKHSQSSVDGAYSLTFEVDELQQITRVITEPPLVGGDVVRFEGSFSDYIELADAPPHIKADARNRGSKVCSYNPHCQTCFCDADGSMTCMPIC